MKQIDAPGDLPLLSSYATPLLALTLPLRAGEQITTTFCYDGHPVPESRTRLVMEPQRSIRVFGREHLAWPVRWRHYGSGDDPSEDECFYIDAGRRLLRLDWGPRYGNCVTEICDRATALAGLPAAVSRSLPWG